MELRLKRRICALLAAFALLFTGGGCVKTQTPDDGLPVLVIGGAEHAPYFYIDEQGNFAGIDVQTAKEACRRMGYKPVFKEIVWVEKDALLERGEIDCLWTCFSMNGREDDYLWAGPYAQDREVIAVLKHSDIYELSDLENKKVAVQMTSKAEDILLANSNASIPPLKNVFSLYDINESVSALKREYVDACVGHEAVLTTKLSDMGIEYRILSQPLIVSSMGVAFLRGGDSAACLKLNAAFAEMRKEGYIKSVFESFGTALIGE